VKEPAGTSVVSNTNWSIGLPKLSTPPAVCGTSTKIAAGALEVPVW